MVFLNVASCSTKFSDVHPVSIFTVMYIFHYIHFTYTGTAILRVWDSAWTYRVTSHWYELLRVTERTVVFDGESRWLDTSDSGHFELYMKREVPTDSLAVHFYGPKWLEQENDWYVLLNAGESIFKCEPVGRVNDQRVGKVLRKLYSYSLTII